MADLNKYAIPDANGIRWAEATTKNGVLYRHGFHHTATPKASAGNEASAINSGRGVIKASGDGGVDVNWPLGTKADHISVCHVTSYDFFATPDDLVYDYQMKFFVDGGWDRTFTDDLNVEYSCVTITNGSHYIQFSSSSTNPAIRHVS
ncbi:hypothetical protein K443DRAFT_685256 [Laccaria amethystina LaAM-08-1]|uniref:Uncharacterized protein n=1 Tax=Laccaria amethystina LaAM-08-1 TaxID=1095629 RepID=A0A0C9WV23_9AGAR|nr:hypothetical protein K443DRAFT_685256 [Laccaria amethystina LaAM-08-1]